MNLGENIYRLRAERNLSQGDLADALEVSRQSVSKWENNSAVPELEKLIKMSRLFGVTLDELVGESEPTPPGLTDPPGRGVTLREIFGLLMLSFSVLVLLTALLVGKPWVETGFSCCWEPSAAYAAGRTGGSCRELSFLRMPPFCLSLPSSEIRCHR